VGATGDDGQAARLPEVQERVLGHPATDAERTDTMNEMQAVNGTLTEHHCPTLGEISRQVADEFAAMTPEAVDRWWALVELAGRADEARRFTALSCVEIERRKMNMPRIRMVRTLTQQLSVEDAPVSRGSVQARVPSLESVMVADDSGRGYAGRRPVAALRAFLSVTVRVNGKTWKVSDMRRAELIAAIDRWDRLAHGNQERADMARDVLSTMTGDERALDAVRRLEQAAA
jgi:hypothetical protein